MGQRDRVPFCLSMVRSARLGCLTNDPTNPIDAKQNRRSFQKAFQRNRWSRIVIAMALAMHVALAAAEPPRFESGPALIDYLDQLYQGQSSEAQMVMEIKTPDYERRLVFKGMTQGDDYAYFQILEPKKDRGIASLMRGEEMWNFLPKINRVVKVPPSMMMNSWMGSDFTNDDLVKQSTLTDLYSVDLEEKEETYLVTLLPKEATVTVWGKITFEVTKDPLLPKTQTYFDEKGDAIRVLRFSDIKQFGERLLPSKMEMTSLRKPGHQTVITYDTLALDVDVPSETFTLQYLRRRR